MTRSLPPVGARVTVDGKREGIVRGHWAGQLRDAISEYRDAPHQTNVDTYLIVEWISGFYDETRTVYTSAGIVHPDNAASEY